METGVNPLDMAASGQDMGPYHEWLLAIDVPSNCYA